MDPASRNPRGAEPRPGGPAYRRARAIPPDAAAVQAALESADEGRPRRRFLPIAVGAVLAGILFSIAAPSPPGRTSSPAPRSDGDWVPPIGEAFGIPMSFPRLLDIDTTLRAADPADRPVEANVRIAFAYAAAGEDNDRARAAIDSRWDAARTALAAWLSGHTRLELFREPGQLRAGLAAALTPALFPDGEGRVVTASLQRVTLR